MASKTLTAATGNYDLGDSGIGSPSRKVIQIVVGSLVGSFVIQGRLTGTSASFVPIPYKSRYVNGAVGTEAYVTTAITGNTIAEVNATGLEIRLAYTHTSGTTSGATLDYVDVEE